MEKSRFYSWILALVSAVAAMGVHFYLSYKYFALRFGGLAEESLCNINATWNCDAVSASAYAQFLGVPLAVWGLVTNLIFVLILLFAKFGWIDNQERGERYTFWFASLIFLASIVMGLVSFIRLDTFCLYCVIAYALSAFTFLGTYFWAKPQTLKFFASDFKNLFSEHKGILVSFIAVPVAAYLVNSMFLDKYNMGSMNIIITEKIGQWKNSPAKTFDKQTGLILQHQDSNPRMEIVEFADFRCSHCRDAYLSLHSFSEAHKDVRFIFKYFPLDGTCNPALSGRGDGISCEAALATHCSEKLFQRGWEAHHHFFKNQQQLQGLTSRQDVRDMLCSSLGLDCEALAQCTDSEDAKNHVQTMAQEGIDAGVQGTPTIYVNDRLLQMGQLIPVLEKVYQSLPAN